MGRGRKRRRGAGCLSFVLTFMVTIAVVLALAVLGCEYLKNSGINPQSYLDELFLTQEEESAASEQEQEEEPAAERYVDEIYYCYYALEEDERTLYLEMYDALSLLESDVKLSTLDSSVLDRIFSCVMSDHPELFYVEGFRYTEHYLGDTLSELTFSGKYSMEKDEAARTLAQIESAAAQWLAAAPASGDEYDTVKYLYEYLINSTQYDTNAQDNQNICSVFLGGSSVCQGYAKAMQYLLQKRGIQTLLVTGYTGTERHAWNVACVNGSYYQLDPTWGDASYSYSGEDSDGGDMSGAPSINYDYFLVTTEEILRTHTIEETVELPVCTATAESYYVREGLLFEYYDRDKLKTVFERAQAQGADFATVKCVNSAVYNEMLSALIDNGEIFDFVMTGGSSVSYTMNDDMLTLSFWNIY